MKKGYIIGLVGCILLLGGCSNQVSYTEDEITFKEEYEVLNDKEVGDKVYLDIKVMDDNNVVYESSEEIIKRLESGTGVIYFGFPECPWCRSVVPVLVNTAYSLGISDIYYFNAKDIRDQKELVNGEVVTKKEGTFEYYRIVELLKDHLGSYEGLEDDSIKRLYFPTVVFVKDGEILGVHIGTVDSQEDPYAGLAVNEEEELSKIYRGYMHQILSDVCDKTC